MGRAAKGAVALLRRERLHQHGMVRKSPEPEGEDKAHRQIQTPWLFSLAAGAGRSGVLERDEGAQGQTEAPGRGAALSAQQPRRALAWGHLAICRPVRYPAEGGRAPSAFL